MEFTKGKWEVINAEDGVFIFSESNLIAEIEEYYNNTMPNALLISKAPEMLEMLNNISQNADRICSDSGEGYLIDDDDMEKLRNLIKSATEL